ncbi:MAG TPA: hypothetical protein VI141_10010 [Acidimicrobiia bacterium]
MAERYRHVVAFGLVIGTLVVLRAMIVGPDELADLARFQELTGVAIGPESAFFASGLDGDGAAFAIVALDPFGQDLGQSLFDPSYRYLRFGYPWLAAAVALGSDSFALAGLALVGLVGAGLVAVIASNLYDVRGIHAWWLVCNPALILGFLGDTAEPLALALLSLSIYSGSKVLGWSLSLVRADYLVALAGRPKVFLAGVATAFVSKALWSLHFGEPILESEGTLTWPLTGFLAAPSIAGWLIVIGALTTLGVGMVKGDASWVVSGAFVLCFGVIVVDTPTNAMRAAGFLPVLWAFGPNFRPVASLRSLFPRATTV